MNWGTSLAIGFATAIVAGLCFVVIGAQYQQLTKFCTAGKLLLKPTPR
jgi:hypothetical protein